MDLKSKGIAWVGNIYQKFETMCHEVDNIVSQDTVKYVENQVQTAGGSLKKFCSGVVQDLLPPLADPVKLEAQAVVLKRNAAVGTYTKSMIGVEKIPVDTVNKQSHVDPSAIDPVKNQLGHAISGLQLVDQLVTPTSVDSLEGSESDLTPGKIDDILTKEKSDLGTENDGKIDDILTKEKSDSSTENDGKIDDILTKEKSDSSTENNGKIDDILTKEKSDSSTENNGPKEKSPASEVLELISPDEKLSFESLSFSEFIDCNNEDAFGLLAKDSPANSVHDGEFQSPQKIGIVCDNFADIYDSSEMDFSVISCERKIAEMGLVSSRSSLLIESYTLFENSLENIPTKAVSYNVHVDVAGCVYESPDATRHIISASTVPCKNNVAEKGLISSNSVVSLESSGPSEYSYDDINDMETIELGNKVKLEDSCVFVDDSELYAVSRRTRKLRSYKKKIQDAFSSKKRLAKEYEQIAIWYGDIDIGSSQDTSRTLMPPTTTITLGSENSDMHHICDSEWELL